MSSYLADRRKSLGYTQKEIATAIGVSEGTVSRWESGEIANMRRDKIAAYAKILQTTPDFIMTGYDEQSLVPPHLEPYKPKGQMPILGRVAAGLPLYAEDNIIGYAANDFADGESYYALVVHGDSMTAAGIDNGDLVVVRQQSAVDDGQIAVVLVNGNDATIKYVRQQGNMVILMPKSYNPQHQPQIYNMEDTPVQVIGRVVQVRKSV